MTKKIGIAIVIVLASAAGCQRSPESDSATAASQASAPAAAIAGAQHPLDPLTEDEIRTAIQTAKSDARLTAAAFPSISVNDPAKADVLAWQPGQPVARQARLQAMTSDRTYEIVIDLGGRRIASIDERAGEPAITYSEIEATKIVLSNAAFQEGLKKRGVTDMTKVFCAPFSAGYYGDPAQAKASGW